MKKNVTNNQGKYFVEWDTDTNKPFKSVYEDNEGLDASLSIWDVDSIVEDLNWLNGEHSVFTDESHSVSRWMLPNCKLIRFEDLSDEWKQEYINANKDNTIK